MPFTIEEGADLPVFLHHVAGTGPRSLARRSTPARIKYLKWVHRTWNLTPGAP